MNRRTLIAVAAIAVVVVGLFLVRLVSNTGDEETIATTTQSTTSTAAVDPTTTSLATTTTTGATATTVAEESGFPVTIEADNGPVTIETRPERIVSISPTSTEVLFAIGAGDQVVAVDSFSTYPEEAPVTDLSAFTPNVEAIASYEPDLVILSFDPGDVIAGLEALDIPVIMHGTAATLDQAYTQWEQLGAATGHIADAVGVVAETTADIDAALATLPDGTDELTYYYELDPTFYSVTSSTFIGEIMSLTGMKSIADEADPDGFGFPQLTAEYIIEQNPTFIYLADATAAGQSAETVAARPGWDTLDAVKNGAVVALDDDVASRWGPRVADLVATIVASINDRELVDA